MTHINPLRPGITDRALVARFLRGASRYDLAAWACGEGCNGELRSHPALDCDCHAEIDRRLRRAHGRFA